MTQSEPGAPNRLGAPVDRRQESYAPSPYASRVVPLSGRVSPDGTRAYPSPSTTAKVVTLGGAAVAAAALTAGGILAVRKLADLVTGNDRLDRRAEAAAERARDRVYDEARGGARPATPAARRTPAPAATTRRPAPARGNFVDEVEHTAQRLNGGLLGAVSSIGAAVSGFRAVAAQAEGILREFHGAADSIRSFLDENAQRARQRAADAAAGEQTASRTVAPGGGEIPADPRTHRL